ncbi:MAG: S8 family serine peptidase [Opitutaceae bacterium]|jgi:hypothetical protein
MVFPPRSLRIALILWLCLLVSPRMAHAVLVGVYDLETNSFSTLLTLNDLVGATGLYNQGVLGANAVVANIEAGFVGTTNLPLGKRLILHLPTSTDATTQVDQHATMTGHVLVGCGSFDPPNVNTYYTWELGIAPLATFYTGAIATTIDGDGSFSMSNTSFFTPYYHAMKGWTSGGESYPAADVINSSWGDSSLHDGSDLMALSLDALVYETKKLVVVSAGNDGPTGQVGSPASGMNTIAVGALGGPSGANPYTTIAEFSSVGPNDYFLPDNASGTSGTVISGVRASVDIVAPGEGFVLAYEGDTNQVYVNAGGTSFAAPTVAGGLALMVDAGRQLMANSYTVGVGDTTYIGVDMSDRLIDARTMKAIMLVSANRNLPGWNNGQTAVDDGNGHTIIRTTQALDWQLGAGAANFTQALNVMTSVGAYNFTSGGSRLVNPVNNTFAVGSTGWDFNTLSTTTGGGVFGYETTLLNSTDLFAVSIAWFTEATYQATFGSENMDVNLEDAFYGSFMNLNLRVYLKADGSDIFQLYAESVSAYNTVELLQFQLPYDAFVRFEVTLDGAVYNFTGATSVDYGIAWQTSAIPEPAVYVQVFGFAILMITLLRRRRR